MQRLFILPFTFYLVYGFLTDNVNNNNNNPGPDVLRDVLDLMVDEKNLRHQLEQVVAQMKQEIEDLKQNQSCKTNGAMATQIHTLQQENKLLNNKIQSLEQRQTTSENKVRTMKVEMDNLRDGAKTGSCFSSCNNSISNNSVGFTARPSGDQNLNGGSTIQFQKIVYNTDNSYNKDTGVFTCPRKGMYIISFSVIANVPISGGAWAEIFKNNKSISMFANTGPDSNDRGSSVAVIHLDVGDTLQIRSQGPYYYRAECYFSGALISPET